MSIIEQATKRMEELRRAGFGPSTPDASGAAPEAAPPASALRIAPPDAAPFVARHLVPAGAPTVPSEPQEPPPVDVHLDLERLKNGGYLGPVDTRSALAEEYRVIKRPLLKNARSKESVAHRLGLIMVTSALPGEGKTYSAINLAMSIATEIDLSVLLIDADVVRPDAMRRLGVEAEAGLMDLLTDESLKLGDLVLRTNVPKLSVLPAGRRHHLSTELLASGAMDDLLRRLANDYPRQVVIFDAPPLLVTSEAKVLATRVGQIVLVVEAGRTRRSAVQQAFAAVEQCPIVMSVLNKSQGPRGDAPYGYGYY